MNIELTTVADYFPKDKLLMLASSSDRRTWISVISTLDSMPPSAKSLTFGFGCEPGCDIFQPSGFPFFGIHFRYLLGDFSCFLGVFNFELGLHGHRLNCNVLRSFRCRPSRNRTLSTLKDHHLLLSLLCSRTSSIRNTEFSIQQMQGQMQGHT
jgi:hypothetical protein